ncbi:helicase-related protein [Dickeya fangzhongdai]|uniref:helicase-related protein n=1 Tax=Dickeya fangzhongdai TaxID=1778540 RepID=UPI0004F71520|nr:helicase-related protein [Dickeya fangzhongdai]AIR69203.1 helicase [Dickeya fangzhongdai]KGU00030.1 helicase [Dickeya fangzhongdai]
MTTKYLNPVIGAVVVYDNKKWVVLHSYINEGNSKVKIRGFKESVELVIPLSHLRSGFQPGMEVLYHSPYVLQERYGIGQVCKTRYLGERDQVLVDFPSIGQQHWLPYETLELVRGPKHRFIVGERSKGDVAERFRMKCLAHAIETWNENSGAFSHLDIDPLPHQIHLVHHILAQDNLNWLIADDVGLGKTIETGMLLKALEQRGRARRILLITPAGLTQQWKEEMSVKFGLDQFWIYGEGFIISEAREWQMFNHVISSIDRLKDAEHFASIMQAEPWDIIVFDEAHRLSRRQYGMKYDISQRFKLARALRKKTEAMVLLSATPHQGKHDKFVSLLELLRPDRKHEIDTLLLNPHILHEMMYRNNKSDVTDNEGNFIFKGKTTKSIKVEISESYKEFDLELQKYLRKGYLKAKSLGNSGNAIGFVMTVYRKLAASSASAILNALQRRKSRIEGEFIVSKGEEVIYEADRRYIGEAEELFDASSTEFFDGEIYLLDKLIDHCKALLKEDRKLSIFMDELINNILHHNYDEKVLIFTEYRSTQYFINQALMSKFGNSKVELINGSMDHHERRNAIARFENGGQFLISTEAGGEGINLQRQCHIMVNYDLPWNPMRLVQRIGRLYRYGQKKRVIVFNMHSPDTADEKIIELMYERIGQVVHDLSCVGDEFNEKLSDDILGEIAELIDVENILRDAAIEDIERTQERIEKALNKAREAVSKQRELFEFAAGFDPSETYHQFIPTQHHLAAFVEGMLGFLNIEIIEKSHNGLIWHICINDELQEELAVRKGRWEITVDRLLAASRPDTHMLDLDNFLMKYMLTTAKSYKFKGQAASIKNVSLDAGALIFSFLRWQNVHGMRQYQEYIAWHINEAGVATLNPPELSEFLLYPLTPSERTNDPENNKRLFNQMEQAANMRLSLLSSKLRHPESIEPVGAAWLTRQD